MTDHPPAKPPARSGGLTRLEPLVGSPVPLAGGVPLFTRIQNRSDKKTIDTYVDVRRSTNDLWTELAREIELKGNLLVRRLYWEAVAEKLPDIKESHREEIKSQLVASKKDADLNAANKDLEIARRELDLAMVRRQITELGEPKAEPAPPPPPLSVSEKMERALQETNKINAVFQKHIDGLRAQAGVGVTTEEVEFHIEKLDLIRKKTIEDLYQSMLR